MSHITLHHDISVFIRAQIVVRKIFTVTINCVNKIKYIYYIIVNNIVRLKKAYFRSEQNIKFLIKLSFVTFFVKCVYYMIEIHPA
jgi:hypothetical protein